jgi:hypothetical protein
MSKGQINFDYFLPALPNKKKLYSGFRAGS